jgi:Na+-translocating ferredoxin:NAD+ oxidoreductase RnfC subunit
VFTPGKVRILLKQHAGAPAVSEVKPGQRVKVGELIAAPAAGALGARVHSSVDGVVSGVDSEAVTIEAS